MAKKQEPKFTASDVDRAKKEAFNEGFNEGFTAAICEAADRLEDLQTLPTRRKYQQT